MIDVDNYRRAVEWFRRGLFELSNDPSNPVVRLSVLPSFEVAFNISETLLRKAYVSLGSDEDATWVSARELILRASDEGLVLSSPKRWMHYGLVLETMRESCLESPDETVEISTELLSSFALELEAFAHVLEMRRSAIA